MAAHVNANFSITPSSAVLRLCVTHVNNQIIFSKKCMCDLLATSGLERVDFASLRWNWPCVGSGA